MSTNQLRRAVIEALGHGARTIPDLRATLGPPWSARGSGRDELDHLLQWDPTFAELSKGIAYLPALLAGTTWTTWIDPDDGADGFVRTHPSLSPLGWWLIGDEVELLDSAGDRLGVLETDGWILDGRDTDVVLGPDGWLDELLGRWASVEVVDGALRWSALDAPPTATAAQVAAVRHGFDRAVRHAAQFERSPRPRAAGRWCTTRPTRPTP